MLGVIFEKSMFEDLKEIFEICRANVKVLSSEESFPFAGANDSLELREEESVEYSSGEVKILSKFTLILLQESDMMSLGKEEVLRSSTKMVSSERVTTKDSKPTLRFSSLSSYS